MIIEYAIVYIILVLVFLCAPLPLQIIFMIANLFISDPIPIIDEALMAVSILKKIITICRIAEFAENHPILFKAIVIVIIALVILWLFY